MKTLRNIFSVKGSKTAEPFGNPCIWRTWRLLKHKRERRWSYFHRIIFARFFFFFLCVLNTFKQRLQNVQWERNVTRCERKKKKLVYQVTGAAVHTIVWKLWSFKTRHWSVTTSSGMSNALRRYFLPKQKTSFLIRRLILSQKIVKEDMIAKWETVVNFGLCA